LQSSILGVVEADPIAAGVAVAAIVVFAIVWVVRK
jgi:hypothetical protein